MLTKEDKTLIKNDKEMDKRGVEDFQKRLRTTVHWTSTR